ncbi:MAG: phosphomannomutase/phosphoglucomutase [Planctomycetota bacterium]
MSIFKAYDVRGIVPDQLNAGLARKIGLAFASFIRSGLEKQAGGLQGNPVVGVGRDARPSGDDLVPALIDGIQRGGCNVVYFGQCTTPMLYFGVGQQKLDGGVMATASHNPPEYNGFKFTREDAIPVSYDTGVGRMEKAVAEGPLPEFEPGGTQRDHNLTADYATYVKKFVRDGGSKRLKIAIDTANGMAGVYSHLFADPVFNIDVVPLFFNIDCTFPNHEANPLKTDTLDAVREAVKANACDAGIAFDGDADRAVAIDEQGEVVRSDITTALIAREMLEREKGSTILYDLRSSRIVPELVKQLGGKPVRVRVGHSFAKAVMREEKAIFGGELSGHCYFRDCYQADSAIVTMVELLNLMRKHGKPLSELVAPLMTYHGTGEINFRVKDKDAMMKQLEATFGPTSGGGEGGDVDWLDGVSVNFADWWFNVRPSNTEPLLRLTLEASTAEECEKRLAQLKSMLGTPVH